MRAKILIVEDEASQRRTLEKLLSSKLGYTTMSAMHGQEALDLLHAGARPDAILLDLAMPVMGGMEVLARLRPDYPELPVVVLTASEEISTAVEAMRLGAHDYVVKPAVPERLDTALRNALAFQQLQHEVTRLSRTVEGQVRFEDLIGQASSFRTAIEVARKAAASSIPVMVRGESGVGKELFARAIHGGSERSGKPFVAVNCGAIPENLVESTLFGHEKGAFSGAVSSIPGKFREADGGTIFLDEIGELPPATQVKLLRALQQNEVEPVGGGTPVPINVRVISATHRPLEAMLSDGRFREDLYYRLHVFPMQVPALRERREDIAVLSEYFLRRFNALERKQVSAIAEDAQALLDIHPWPGNVRQLENAMFRAVVLTTGAQLTLADFPELIRPSLVPRAEPETHHSLALVGRDGHFKTLEQLEQEIIQRAMSHYGQMAEVARRLQIGRSTLYRKTA